MMSYSNGLLLNNANNYGIVKTEAVFGFSQPSANLNVDYNGTRPVKWIWSPIDIEEDDRKEPKTSRSLKYSKKPKQAMKMIKQKDSKRIARKKCIVKVMNKDKGVKRRRKNKKMYKKIMMPLLVGLMAAKSVLIPVALKALAFMSAKGFLMGFFSTILASFLSLKGMFEHSHHHQERKDEKTQVEIIHVPPKHEHIYENDYYSRRRDQLVPLPVPIGDQIKKL